MSTRTGILFVGAEDEENLALRCLASFCQRDNIRVDIAGFSHAGYTRRVLEAQQRFQPAILAVSVAFQCKALESFALLEHIRRTGFTGHILIGGHFPTFEYREILRTQPAVDSVLRFEGEHGITALYRALQSDASLSTVPNLVWRDGEIIRENPCQHGFMNLDDLPYPLRARRAQTRLGEGFASLISSRGCWHSSCIYCCIGAFHGAKGAKFALRSAASVADEIATLHRRHHARLFQFHDDNFVLGTPAETCARLTDIRHALNARGIMRLAFLIKARPDVVDESVADALDNLGCVGVFLGVENATESGLRALARGANLAAVNRAMDALARRGMAITYNLLVFHPHATVEEVRANIAFIRAHPTVPFDFGRAEIVAGSPLERLTIQENLRCGTWPQWDYRLRDPAAQRAFDMYRDTFRAPGGAYSALMHQLIALSYHAVVVQRLNPGASAEAAAHAVHTLLAASNEVIARHIEKMLALAEAPDSVAVGAFRQSLHDHCQGVLVQVGKLTDALLRLQAAERVFKRFGIQSMVQETPWLPKVFGIPPGEPVLRSRI